MSKKYDLAVKVGTYKKDGQDKARYLNIGAVMNDKNGGTYMLLNKTFNPAGVPDERGGDSIIVSMFEPNNKGQMASANNAPTSQNTSNPPVDDMEDEIPF